MPSTIPYDPSLVLGNVVSDEILKIVRETAAAQAPIDEASEHLSSLLSQRRQLDKTATELRSFGVETDAIDKQIDRLNQSIADSAAQCAAAKMHVDRVAASLREEIASHSENVETPVSLDRTEMKSLSLSSGFTGMDVQYFSFDENSRDSNAFASTISGYIATSTSSLGIQISTRLGAAAAKQVIYQTSKQDIAGTLVLAVSCRHKNSLVLDPFILDVDKGIHAYNHVIRNAHLNPTNRKEMVAIAAKDERSERETFRIISGMTFGSSFVGMVHVLKPTFLNAPSLKTAASTLQAQVDAGDWLEDASNGSRVSATFSMEIKNLLSQQSVASRVTLLSMGVIPSLIANEMKLGVGKFDTSAPKASAEAVFTIDNKAKAALSTLGEIQDSAVRALDISFMMDALDQYMKEATVGTGGVPIDYYLKDITKSMLAQLWVMKYFPGQSLSQLQEDDR